ncbi:MAG: alpha/beta hydrolase-fold protein [Planctomycetaceae bacterium]
MSVGQAEPIAPIERVLPPRGITLDPAVRAPLQERLRLVEDRFRPHTGHALAPDVEILLTAVQSALKFDEFYSEDDAGRALELLNTAGTRVDALQAGTAPWTEARGLLVRGYRSSIDESVQPYGLEIPDDIDLTRPVPLYVWLHGRGDKTTNLQFLYQRQKQPGQIAPAGAIVLHPFGRHCLGYKSAGEIDVLEAVAHVASQYPIDSRRIVLMGFSMGGAGCWHIGAHYPDRWVAMSPGAGFVETARYQNINPDDVVWYERSLWGMYDVPDYVRNLFNLPVVAYSGETDKQIQAAQMMEAAYAAEGQKLDHRIGPGMGHKYAPETLAAILESLKADCDRGLNSSPRRVTLQTRTLRYHRVHWVDVQRLQEHWQDARIDAVRADDGSLNISTRNVTALRLKPENLNESVPVTIDGQTLTVAPVSSGGDALRSVSLVRQNGLWSAGALDAQAIAKQPGLQGPLDDAFLEPFLVVVPSGRSPHAGVQAWVEFEQQHFLDRWEALFRGRARVKRDTDVTTEDMSRYHLILWGDPTSNAVLKRIADRLPIRWSSDAIAIGDKPFAAAGHVLTMIYPNPDAPGRYVVLNSGPTFREGHDRTNSLQNPKLPDWAVVDLSQPPDAIAPGRIAAADFFDEQWQLRRRP